MSPSRSHRMPEEFILACRCCQWPPSELRDEAVRAAARSVNDWDLFLRVVQRQRIAGFVQSALSSANVDLPPHVEQHLVERAQQTARQNLLLTAEAVRLQSVFDAAGISVVFFKGVTLAQLAYGSLSLKHGKDIDLLVLPDRAETAIQLLEREGYALWEPAEYLSEAQLRAVICYGKEVAFVHRQRNVQVELHWRLVESPPLLEGVDASTPTQDVALSSGVSIRSFVEEDLFAYLCVHGARHGWSRLKWIADLNALIAAKSDAEIIHLHRHAQAKGAGLCAGQALILCHRLLKLKLPPALGAELCGSGRLERLVRIAMGAMVGSDAETELENRPFGSTRISLAGFLLGQGWTYFYAHCRSLLMMSVDVIRYPLPSSLHFLYPIIRIPLWFCRRLRYLARGAPAVGDLRK
jgi:hypothetical protein